MPKLYEYFGLTIFFYSNEHPPIHVHARKGEFESKAEFIVVNGKIEEVKIQSVAGYRPLKGNDLLLFKEFLIAFGDEVIQKWVDYFVYNKSISCVKITAQQK